MDRAKAKALLPIITAYADGKNVEIMTSDGTWCVIQCPDFNSDASDYRIKPRSSRDDYIRRHDAYGLKIGDRVRVVRSAMHHEDGWGTVWNEVHMNDTVKKMGTIVDDKRGDGFLVKVDSQERTWHYPCFVLEKVECNYRPFANAEEFKPNRDRWLINKNTRSMCKVFFIEGDRIWCGGFSYSMRYPMLFEYFEFEDGTPCGVLVDDASEET